MDLPLINKSNKRRLKKLLEYRVQIYNKDEQKPVDTEKDHTMLVIIEGDSYETLEVKKRGDEQRLVYERNGEDKECKITSKPVIVDNTDFYFTRDGFVGTMALHKDTLLGADKYTAPTDALEADADERDKQAGWQGEIELAGSKGTLRQSNKAILEKELLKKSKMDKTKMVGLLAAGAIIGAVIMSQYMGA